MVNAVDAVDAVGTMQEELERAAETGHYLSEYNNGIVVSSPMQRGEWLGIESLEGDI